MRKVVREHPGEEEQQEQGPLGRNKSLKTWEKTVMKEAMSEVMREEESGISKVAGKNFMHLYLPPTL